MTSSDQAPDGKTLREERVTVGEFTLNVVRAGDPAAPAVLFLHGWPESARSWAAVQRLAAAEFHAVAVDLPGIGGSAGPATDGSKAALAAVVGELIEALGLREVVLVGQDAGGMVAYRCLRDLPGLRKVVIMDVVVPGLGPWEEVLHNPHVWHFGFHSTPDLPERMVQGKQRAYFDFFYDFLSVDPSAIDDAARDAYAAAYATDAALTAGFNWYRTFPADAERNAADREPVDTPLLYLRGEREGGTMADYLTGFAEAGVRDVTSALIPDAGHFTQEEAPEATWAAIEAFIRA